MQHAKQKTAWKGKKVSGGFKTSQIAEMFECGGVMLP